MVLVSVMFIILVWTQDWVIVRNSQWWVVRIEVILVLVCITTCTSNASYTITTSNVTTNASRSKSCR